MTTNLNYNFYSGLKVITRKVNTGNYSNQNNSPVPTPNYEINDRVRWPVLTFHNYKSIHSCQKVVVGTNGGI
jgi:hypothetical protein